MPWQVNYARAWAHWFGHLLAGLGLLAAQQTLQELSWLSLFLPPSPRFYSTSFFFPPYALFLPLLFCFHHFLYLLVSCSPLPLPPFPCSMRHQVGSATLGCRAALRVTSATACLRARGPGISLQTSMKPCIVWTGFSMVSLQHTSMEALEGFAGCDA